MRRRPEQAKPCALSDEPFSTAGLGPPRPGIDSRPILTELNIENGLFRANSDCSGGACLSPSPIDADRLAGENELADLDANSRHARQNNIIAVAGIDYQELTVGAVGARKGHPAVRRSGNDGVGARGDREAPLGAAEPVRRAESLAHLAGHRTRQKPSGAGESDGGRRAAPALANGDAPRARRLSIGLQGGRPPVLLGLARGVRGAPRARHLALHAGDQILEIERLPGQRAGALALGLERLLGLADGGCGARRPARRAARAPPPAPEASARSRSRSPAIVRAQRHELGKVGGEHLGFGAQFRHDAAQQHRGADRLQDVLGRDEQRGRRAPAHALQARQELRR